MIDGYWQFPREHHMVCNGKTNHPRYKRSIALTVKPLWHNLPWHCSTLLSEFIPQSPASSPCWRGMWSYSCIIWYWFEKISCLMWWLALCLLRKLLSKIKILAWCSGGHGFDACPNSDFFSVPCSCHVDQFNFYNCMHVCCYWLKNYYRRFRTVCNSF